MTDFSRGFDVGDRQIGDGQAAYVIAEAGSNHNGHLETAEKLIAEAAEAGADAVKFQTFRRERLYATQPGEEDPYASFAELEMPYDWIPTLADCCAAHGVDFLSTPFDEESIERLAPHVPAFKIASFSLSHHPFLERLAETGTPLFASTGAHDADEIRAAVTVLREAGLEDLALLHCVSSYPTPLADINVRAVATLAERFDVVSGLSDHTEDPVTAPTAAVALGGHVVEKHFTLDRTMEGPDHAMSVEPDGLGALVDAVRRTERALGDGAVGLRDVESGHQGETRRAVHTTAPVAAGERFTEDNVAVLRPGEREPGVDPAAYDEVLGATAVDRLERGEGVDTGDFE
jgi:N-acetylneuraminate synthase